MLELETSSERAQLLNSKDSSQIECSIWFLHQRAISVYICIYMYIFVYIWEKKTNKLQVHPYKPVSWSPTDSGSHCIGLEVILTQSFYFFQTNKFYSFQTIIVN